METYYRPHGLHQVSSFVVTEDGGAGPTHNWRIAGSSYTSAVLPQSHPYGTALGENSTAPVADRVTTYDARLRPERIRLTRRSVVRNPAALPPDRDALANVFHEDYTWDSEENLLQAYYGPDLAPRLATTFRAPKQHGLRLRLARQSDPLV